MKWFGLVGMVSLVMAAGCGTESAPPVVSPGNTGESVKAPPSEPVAATTGADSATDTPKMTSPHDTAKPSAPVEMTAKLRPGGADMDIVFAADATNVTIKVWGVDGLTITKGATPVSAASMRSGQSMKVAVEYDAPATASNIAMSVSGVFGGREQIKVQSFTVNAGAPSAAAPAGEVKVDKDGRRVKVMK